VDLSWILKGSGESGVSTERYKCPATPATPATPNHTDGGGDHNTIETKSLTPAIYEAIGDTFRSWFGAFAGWAHSILFAAELGTHKAKLPQDMQQTMKTFSEQQRSAKKAVKEEKLSAKQRKMKDEEEFTSFS
jgi:hypothetical protein